ncbi:hypothetical protein PZH42_30425, partial [Bacteroides cellulosilyticus]|nr:hypothetical protein [Bacteroides cellulosilyticus]
RPVSELRSLRYNEKSYAAQNISKVTPLVGATGDVKEIVVEIVFGLHSHSVSHVSYSFSRSGVKPDISQRKNVILCRPFRLF